MFSSITCFALHRGELLVFLLILCSARFRTSCFISLCLCLLLPWERSFLSKGTVFLLKPQLLLWFCTNSNGHPCKQACRCLFLFVQKSSVFVFYGNIGTCCKPSFSGNPNIMFMFCTAWPAAPFTRLSIAPIIIILPVLSSTLKLTSTKLLPSTHLVSGGVLFSSTLTKYSSL